MEQRKSGHYSTYAEAVCAAELLGLKSMAEYVRQRDKKTCRDPRLPADPARVYKNKGWISWQHFLTPAQTQKRRGDYYATYQEAAVATRKLGIKTVNGYKNRRDSKLPMHPDRTYENKGWVSWTHFLGKKS